TKWLKLERIYVEPFVRSLRPGIGITNLIGAVAKCLGFTLVVGQQRSLWPAALDYQVRIHLPATDKVPDYSPHTRTQSLPQSETQLINGIEDETMPSSEG